MTPGGADSRHGEGHKLRAPIALATLAGLLIFGWLALVIRHGPLTNKDEFMTAERAREMLTQTPWAVHENFAVTFQKPPLQYWLTAVSLRIFGEGEGAVRLTPLLYGILTAAAVGWLAFLTDRTRPWLIPLAVGALLGCPLFLTETSRALLDTGLAFYATLALCGGQLARTRPRWWIGVALACALGALQKGPVVLVLFLLVIASRWLWRSETESWKWIFAALVLALVLSALWPALQMAHFGMAWRDLWNTREALELRGASRLGARSYFEIPFRLVTTWPLGAVALCASGMCLTRNRHARNPVAGELAFVALSFTALALLANFRSVRYVLPVVPAFCVPLALLVHEVGERSLRRRGVVLLFTLGFLFAGVLVAAATIAHRQRDHAAQLEIARRLGEIQDEVAEEILLEPDRSVLPEQFFLFYGNLRHPLVLRTRGEIWRAPGLLPAAGVCSANDFSAVRAKYPDAVIDRQSGEFICWRAQPSAAR